MYDETRQPSETLVMDWNEHNDHADDLGEQEPDAAVITELYAFAATYRDTVNAARLRREQQQRAESIERNERGAGEAWNRCFRGLPNQWPPALAWRGYPSGQQTGPDAVAHLGDGIFLTFRYLNRPDWPSEYFELTTTCPSGAIPSDHTVRIDDLEQLAEALDPLLGPEPRCAFGGCIVPDDDTF
jgi:hypothetical protein